MPQTHVMKDGNTIRQFRPKPTVNFRVIRPNRKSAEKKITPSLRLHEQATGDLPNFDTHPIFKQKRHDCL